MNGRRAAHGAIAAGAIALVASGLAACRSGDGASDDAGARACGLVVWHKPASTSAHVEIIGDWNGWQRPGVEPERRDGGWRVAAFDPPPGEHAYAIIEDGVWLADPNVPTTAFHDGHEVALADVADCSSPALRVDSVEGTPDGDVTIEATYLRARGGPALDPKTIVADGLTVASVDPLVLKASGLTRGKYTYAIAAGGAPAVPAVVWIEPEPWTPNDAIIYQVIVDRYRAADSSGHAVPLKAPSTPAERAGGTIAGLRAAVESGEIAALGVNTLWVSPLYANPDGDFPGTDGHAYSSYHGYWPVQSRAIDERVADEAELDRFMTSAHSHGLRVLFDVVPNHVHQQHPYVAAHPDWFKQDCVCGQGSCDWGAHIQTCWFAPYLPDLDWADTDVARAATDDVMWWLDRWGGDGLRIDAVPMMPRAASRRIMAAVRGKYTRPGNATYVIGENFTGPGGYDSLRYDIGPQGLDGTFHFPLMWALRSAVATETAPMSAIADSVHEGDVTWEGAGAVMGTIIGNHDVARFASVSAGNDGGDTWSPAAQPLDPVVYAKQRIALAAALTLPGAPVLYYGDEVGLAGKSDPDCRRVMPADGDLASAQIETRDLARKLGKARACVKTLRRGAAVPLLADAEHFVFSRQIEGDPSSTALVVLSRRPSSPVRVALPAGASTRLVDMVTGEALDASSGVVPIDDEPFTVHVYVDAATATTCR